MLGVEGKRRLAGWWSLCSIDELHSINRLREHGEQYHRGEDETALQARGRLYAEARVLHPTQWIGSTLNWRPIQQIWLNPKALGATGTDQTLNVA